MRHVTSQDIRRALRIIKSSKTKISWDGFMLNEGGIPNLTIWWYPFKDFFFYMRLQNYRWCWTKMSNSGWVYKGRILEDDPI